MSLVGGKLAARADANQHISMHQGVQTRAPGGNPVYMQRGWWVLREGGMAQGSIIVEWLVRLWPRGLLLLPPSFCQGGVSLLAYISTRQQQKHFLLFDSLPPLREGSYMCIVGGEGILLPARQFHAYSKVCGGSLCASRCAQDCGKCAFVVEQVNAGCD